MGFCRQCGAELRKTLQFCPQCGAAIDETINTERSNNTKPSDLSKRSPQNNRSPEQTLNIVEPTEQSSIAWRAGLGALGKSLSLSLLVLGPGFVMLFNGAVIPGMIWLFLGSFGLMAWTYRKPWQLSFVSCLIPPLIAGLCYLVQLILFGNAMPPLIMLLIAIGLGLSVGHVRGKAHNVYKDENGSIIAQRTLAYLGIWVVCYGLTQLLGLTAREKFLVQGGLVSGAFSTAMLVMVSVMLYRRASNFLIVGIGLFLLLCPSPAFAKTSDIDDQLNQFVKNASRKALDSNLIVGLPCIPQIADFSYAYEFKSECQTADKNFSVYFKTSGRLQNHEAHAREGVENLSRSEEGYRSLSIGDKAAMTSKHSKNKYACQQILLRDGETCESVRRDRFVPTSYGSIELRFAQGKWIWFIYLSVKSPAGSLSQNHLENMAIESARDISKQLNGLVEITSYSPDATWVPILEADTEAAAAAVALISMILLAGGIGANIAQAVAMAVASGIQATAETTAQEISDAMAQAKRAPPPIYDKDGTAFETNEHGQYWAQDSQGNWRWLSEGEARQTAAILRQESKERDQEADAFERAADLRRSELKEAGQKHDREEDAAHKETIAQTAAKNEIERMKKAAMHVGDDEIKSRLLSDRIYNEDGSIDEDYLQRVKSALRNRIALEVAAPEHKLLDRGYTGIVRDGLRGSMKDASDSFVARLVAGAASGGWSEAFFQGYATIEGIQKSANAAEDAGKEMSRFEALKQAGSDFVKENMPVNTVDALNRWHKGEDVSWSEMGMSMFADGAALMDIKEATGLSPGTMADNAAKRLLSDKTYDAMSKRTDAVTGAVAEKIDIAKKNITLSKDAALEKIGLKSDHRLSVTQAEARFNETSLSSDTQKIIDEAQTSGVTKDLDEAFQRGRAAGQEKVNTLADAVKELKKSRTNPDIGKMEIERLERKVRDEVLRVQADKHAMNEMNKLPKIAGENDTIKAFNTEMNGIYKEADDRMIQRLADELGVRPEDVQRVEITNKPGPAGAQIDPRAPARDHHGLASEWDKKGYGSNSRAASNPDAPRSNASATETKNIKGDKVSFDRDLTMRVRTIDPRTGRVVYRDIPSTTTARIYNEEFYKAAKGVDQAPTPSRKLIDTGERASVDFKDTHVSMDNHLRDPLDIDDADTFAKVMDQASTDRLHPEAYGTGQADLDTATKDSFRGRDLTDATGTAKTVEFKVQHWMNEADELREAAKKELNPLKKQQLLEKAMASHEESQRQLVKQYKNMVITRTRAMQMLNNAPNTSIPRSLSERINVLKRVQMEQLTPAQAEEVLKRMGSSTKQLASQMSSYIEGLQNLRPPSHVPGIKPAPALVVKGWKDEFQHDKQQ